MKISFPVLLFAAAAVRLSSQIEVVSNGNVGIGTTSPDRKLHVVRTASDGVAGATASSYEIAQFKVNSSGGGQRGLEIGAPTGGMSASPVYLKVHGTGSRFALLNESDIEQLTVTNGGNVGIGTNGPSQRLEVRGLSGGFPATSGTNQPHASARITNDQTSGVLDIGVYSAGGAWLQYTHREDLSQAYPLLFNPNGGNVGIGTTSPAGKLHLASSGHTALILDTAGQNSPYLSFRQSNVELGYIQYQDNGAGTDYLTYTAPNHSFQGGNVGIGTASPGYKLHVNGVVRGSSFISDTQTYADFVFKPDYRLPALSEVEAHIKERGHLPGIPSEAEAKANGIDLAAMQVKLLQKVEELTLHVIALEKRTKALESENAFLKSQP